MKNKYKLCLIMIVIIIMASLIYSHMTKHIYFYVNKLNSFFSRHCKDPSVFNPVDFEWTQNFRNNWKSIRDEYLRYANMFDIPLHKKTYPSGATCDNNNKWKTLYLRAFNRNTNIAKLFPQTMKIINNSPCTLAYFSILEPGAKLDTHIGIYKGVIRYHLGLLIPKEWQKCFIRVEKNILYWREGQDIMFDDMFPHEVQNNSNEVRVILFLDIKRDFHNIFLNMINTIALQFIKSNDILKDVINNVNSQTNILK